MTFAIACQQLEDLMLRESEAEVKQKLAVFPLIRNILSGIRRFVSKEEVCCWLEENLPVCVV